MRIGLFQAMALPVVACGAAKLAELVLSLPTAILLHIAKLREVWMCANRFVALVEARIVDRDVTAFAAVYDCASVRILEARNDVLLELRVAPFQRGFLGGRLRHSESLIQIFLLAVLPMALELAVDHHSSKNQQHQTQDG